MFSQCSVYLLTFNQASEFNPWMYGDDCNDCNYDFDEHESQHVVVGAMPLSLVLVRYMTVEEVQNGADTDH